MKTNRLTVKLQTLTPLWTGGVETGKMDRIHETGIIGSLRWWYEAIVRGLGGNACDPTSDERCPDKKGRLCDVCYFFGATGLKRAFRIQFDLKQSASDSSNSSNQLTVKVDNNRGWFLKRGCMGTLNGMFSPLRIDTIMDRDDILQVLALVLKLQEKWAGLGAKCQQGYGVVRFSSLIPALNINEAVSVIKKIKERPNRIKRKSTDLPNLREFFFAKIRFDAPSDPISFISDRSSNISPNNKELEWYFSGSPNNSPKTPFIPIAPIIRYHLRNLIRENILFNEYPNALSRWQLMGVLNGTYHKDDRQKLIKSNNFWECPVCGAQWLQNSRPEDHRSCNGRPERGYRYEDNNNNVLLRHVAKIEKQKSLIQSSHAYLINENTYEFRIWGWIPSCFDFNREEVLSLIKEWMGIEPTACNNTKVFSDIKKGKLLDVQHFRLINLNPKIMWIERRDKEDGESFLKRMIG